MNLFVSKLNKSLNFQLHKIDLEEADIIRKSQKSIHCVKKSLTQLKEFVLQHNFCSEKEEIRFFKEIKPEIFSQLIYYVKIFNIESHRPMGSYKIQKNYLQHELEKLTFFFNNHLEFYQYYRMNSTFLDDKYFVRGKEDVNLYHDSLMFYVDPDFSTSHDYVVAKIMANDRLEVYLKTELESLALKSANPNWGQLGNIENNPLKWTDSKTALVELIYALYAAGSINKGQSEIRELAAFFEQSFDVRLTDIYRTYLEIKIRSTPAKYLDTLKSALLRKMEEDY
ncbi:MAG: RteC domain-containing protein [Paludibacter sp.]|nr:RteC domain-containing protein [Paludibacter sp.]